MKRSTGKVKIGILGCGAIGSRIACSIRGELRRHCELSGLYDHDPTKVEHLARQFRKPQLKRSSVKQLMQSADLVVEAVSGPAARSLIKTALSARRHVLVMSVGQLLDADDLFRLAARNTRSLLIPSGAIAGIDAVKAAAGAGITSLTLTTRKPTSGFKNTPYLQRRRIDPESITKETTIFSGNVRSAVKHFPQNINVAATLALASGTPDRLKIRIITSPKFKNNSHEIEATGPFGRLVCRTENAVCPDNPKTSYLAVLSAIRTLQDFCSGRRIGT